MKTITATLGAVFGLLLGLTVPRAPEHYTPPPISISMHVCPKQTPEQYRQELVEAGLAVGMRCAPAALFLREDKR